MPVCLTCQKKLNDASEVTKHLMEGHVVYTQPNEPIEGQIAPFGFGEPENLIENWGKNKRAKEGKV